MNEGEKKIIAINGSYRRGGITDQTVDVVREGSGESGVRTEKIYLMDKRIEFCTNCRACTSSDENE